MSLSYKERLTILLKRHQPENVGFEEVLLRNYPGCEEMYLTALAERYGDEVPGPVPPKAIQEKSPQRLQQAIFERQVINDDDGTSYTRAVEELKHLPRVEPPKPVPLPPLRPAPPVGRLPPKPRPLPLDAQISMFNFEENTARQALALQEQRNRTAIVVTMLHQYVLTGSDIVGAEQADRQVVEREEERAMMCITEDVIASLHNAVKMTMLRVQEEGSSLQQRAIEAPKQRASVQEEEEKERDDLINWERMHRPYDNFSSPGRFIGGVSPQKGYHTSAVVAYTPEAEGRERPEDIDCMFPNVRNVTKVVAPGNVLVPVPPILSLDRLEGRTRWGAEKERLWQHKRKEMQRTECIRQEEAERLDIEGDETRGFLHIEAVHIEDMFALENKLRRPLLQYKKAVPQSDEDKFAAARRIQCMGRRYLARRRVSTRKQKVNQLVEEMAESEAALAFAEEEQDNKEQVDKFSASCSARRRSLSKKKIPPQDRPLGEYWEESIADPPPPDAESIKEEPDPEQSGAFPPSALKQPGSRGSRTRDRIRARASISEPPAEASFRDEPVVPPAGSSSLQRRPSSVAVTSAVQDVLRRIRQGLTPLELLLCVAVEQKKLKGDPTGAYVNGLDALRVAAVSAHNADDYVPHLVKMVHGAEADSPQPHQIGYDLIGTEKPKSGEGEQELAKSEFSSSKRRLRGDREINDYVDWVIADNEQRAHLFAQPTLKDMIFFDMLCAAVRQLPPPSSDGVDPDPSSDLTNTPIRPAVLPKCSLNGPWKPLLELAILQAERPDELADVQALLRENDLELPTEEERAVYKQSKQRQMLFHNKELEATRQSLIEKKAFNPELLQSVVWHTFLHKYQSHDYERPVRWAPYGTNTEAVVELEDEETHDIVAFEENDREGLINMQIRGILSIWEQYDVILRQPLFLGAEVVPPNDEDNEHRVPVVVKDSGERHLTGTPPQSFLC